MKRLKMSIAAILLLAVTYVNAQDGHNHNHNTMKMDSKKMDHSKMTIKSDAKAEAILSDYLNLKDALVNTDASTSSAKATELVKAIKAVEMAKLSTEEHTVWMKVMKDLIFDTEHIEETKDVGHQRDHFNTLSDNMYQLLKVSKQETPTYYQHCPMANNGKGANWLSKENAVKNPYYGSKMLTCGKTVETIE